MIVADDQVIVRRCIVRLLAADGHEVLSAADGEEALRIYASCQPRPDILVVDLDMPSLADAILDRLVHNAYKLTLRGPSGRKVKEEDRIKD